MCLSIKPYLSDGMVQPPQPLSYLKGEPQFSADYILNKRIVRKGHKSATQYLIRWTDCGPANDTWEPSSNISNKDLISDLLGALHLSVRIDLNHPHVGEAASFWGGEECNVLYVIIITIYNPRPCSDYT